MEEIEYIIKTYAFDGKYTVNLNNQGIVNIYNIASNEVYTDLEEYIYYRERDTHHVQFHIYLDENEEHILIIGGVFRKGDSKSNNLLAFNISTRTVKYISTVSPSGRTPTVRNIVAVTKKYVVLLACYGFMDQSFRLFYADVNTGEYLTILSSEAEQSIFNSCYYNDKYALLIGESTFGENKRSVELLDIDEMKLIVMLEDSVQDSVSSSNYP